MTRIWNRTLVLVAAAGIALACQTQEQATEQGSETSPAVDAAAAREAILAQDDVFAAAMVAGDSETLTRLYTADAVILPPNGPRGEGAEAVREIWAAALEGSPMSEASLESDIVTVAAAGDYAYAVGRYAERGTGPDGSEWSDQGKYLTVWKNVDGEWKIAVDTWNSDRPLPGTASAEPVPAE